MPSSAARSSWRRSRRRAPGSFRCATAESLGPRFGRGVIPGRTNRILLDATRPGRYRAGATKERDATAGGTGLDAFLAEACSSYHRIRGTPAQGDVGPDLTDVASRQTIAGALLPNTPDELADWISDPQHFKPGTQMPALGLPGDEMRPSRGAETLGLALALLAASCVVVARRVLPDEMGGADEMTHIRHTSGARHFLWTDWHEIVTPKCQALVVDNRTEEDVA